MQEIRNVISKTITRCDVHFTMWIFESGEGKSSSINLKKVSTSSNNMYVFVTSMQKQQKIYFGKI